MLEEHEPPRLFELLNISGRRCWGSRAEVGPMENVGRGVWLKWDFKA